MLFWAEWTALWDVNGPQTNISVLEYCCFLIILLIILLPPHSFILGAAQFKQKYRKGCTCIIVLSWISESNVCWWYLAASPLANRVWFCAKLQVHCLTKTMSLSFIRSVSIIFPCVSSSGRRPGRNHEEPLSRGVTGLCLQAAGDPGEEEVWVCRAGEGFSNSACSICQQTIFAAPAGLYSYYLICKRRHCLWLLQMLAFFQTVFTFYHQGYELAKDFDHYKRALQINIQNVSDMNVSLWFHCGWVCTDC